MASRRYHDEVLRVVLVLVLVLLPQGNTLHRHYWRSIPLGIGAECRDPDGMIWKCVPGLWCGPSGHCEPHHIHDDAAALFKAPVSSERDHLYNLYKYWKHTPVNVVFLKQRLHYKDAPTVFHEYLSNILSQNRQSSIDELTDSEYHPSTNKVFKPLRHSYGDMDSVLWESVFPRSRHHFDYQNKEPTITFFNTQRNSFDYQDHASTNIVYPVFKSKMSIRRTTFIYTVPVATEYPVHDIILDSSVDRESISSPESTEFTSDDAPAPARLESANDPTQVNYDEFFAPPTDREPTNDPLSSTYDVLPNVSTDSESENDDSLFNSHVSSPYYLESTNYHRQAIYDDFPAPPTDSDFTNDPLPSTYDVLPNIATDSESGNDNSLFNSYVSSPNYLECANDPMQSLYDDFPSPPTDSDFTNDPLSSTYDILPNIATDTENDDSLFNSHVHSLNYPESTNDPTQSIYDDFPVPPTDREATNDPLSSTCDVLSNVSTDSESVNDSSLSNSRVVSAPTSLKSADDTTQSMFEFIADSPTEPEPADNSMTSTNDILSYTSDSEAAYESLQVISVSSPLEPANDATRFFYDVAPVPPTDDESVITPTSPNSDSNFNTSADHESENDFTVSTSDASPTIKSANENIEYIFNVIPTPPTENEYKNDHSIPTAKNSHANSVYSTTDDVKRTLVPDSTAPLTDSISTLPVSSKSISVPDNDSTYITPLLKLLHNLFLPILTHPH